MKTLLLYSNGASWKHVTSTTLFRGVMRLRLDEMLPERLLRSQWVRALAGKQYDSLSYVNDWQEAFCGHPALDVDLCNTTDLVDYFSHIRRVHEYDLIVVLHSAAGDGMSVLLKTAALFQRRRGKLLVFIGNEYDLMPEKIQFVRSTGAEFLGSQLPIEAARWLYAECVDTEILTAPHALNPEVYTPDRRVVRDIDLGFVGDVYPLFIGDIERTKLIEFFRDRGDELSLHCDIRFTRLPRSEWASFLRRCRGVIGAESGTYYLERDDRTIRSVRAYLASHPNATFDEVFEKFFRDHPRPVSGKAISSRHFEPIGTQTCQMLLEGEYNGILRADEHYIALKRDLSNVDDAVGRFLDDDYRREMVVRTYDYVLSEHTYRHRVARILETVADTAERRDGPVLGRQRSAATPGIGGAGASPEGGERLRDLGARDRDSVAAR